MMTLKVPQDRKVYFGISTDVKQVSINRLQLKHCGNLVNTASTHSTNMYSQVLLVHTVQTCLAKYLKYTQFKSVQPISDSNVRTAVWPRQL